jgi:hypothetical protein
MRAQGGVVYYMQLLARALGMGGAMHALAEAPTLAAQRAAWDGAWFVRFCHTAPAWLVDTATRCLAVLFFNRFVMWCARAPAPLPSTETQLLCLVATCVVVPSWQHASKRPLVQSCDCQRDAALHCKVLWCTALWSRQAEPGGALVAWCQVRRGRAVQAVQADPRRRLQSAQQAQPGVLLLPRFGAGVPCKQYKLIHADGLRISTYVARTFDGVARTSHLRRDNYFYYSCCTGARAAPPWPLRKHQAGIWACAAYTLCSTSSGISFLWDFTADEVMLGPVVQQVAVQWAQLGRARIVLWNQGSHLKQPWCSSRARAREVCRGQNDTQLPSCVLASWAGRFARDNCPAYLIKENFLALKNGLIDNLTICTGTFLDALTSRTYTKARALCKTLLCCLGVCPAPNLATLGAVGLPGASSNVGGRRMPGSTACACFGGFFCCLRNAGRELEGLVGGGAWWRAGDACMHMGGAWPYAALIVRWSCWASWCDRAGRPDGPRELKVCWVGGNVAAEWGDGDVAAQVILMDHVD